MSDKYYPSRHGIRPGYPVSLLHAAAALYDIEAAELAAAASKASRTSRKYGG